ncbi:MAG: hypothetical protein ACRDRM_08505 [Pseudonocardiaceae bacterium]
MTTDLLRLPVPVPGNGHTDSATEAMRNTLDAVATGHPPETMMPPGRRALAAPS